MLTTLLVMAGYTVYTYVSLVYHRATGGDGTILAVLLFAFGIGGIVGTSLSVSGDPRAPCRLYHSV